MILELLKEVLSKSSWPFCWVSTKKKNLLVKFLEELKALEAVFQSSSEWFLCIPGRVLVHGANIASFLQVAQAMLEQGCVWSVQILCVIILCKLSSLGAYLY
jgi:hypothetical protein